MKPVCVNCKVFMKPKKNGFVFEEGRPIGQGDQNGAAEWRPYKLWLSDLWECRECGAQVALTLPTQGPIAEHYQERYSILKELEPPEIFVKDC